MRRVLSTIFLVLGGWMLMVEPLLAYMDFGADMRSAMPIVILIDLVMAGVPLAIGIGLSPGDRRRELGLTILLSMGAAVFSGASLVAVFTDPGFKQFMPLMPPMPKIGVAPLFGTLNLLLVTVIGWLLWRGRERARA